MSSLILMALALQPEALPLLRDTQKFFIISAAFAIVVTVALVLTIRQVRKANNASAKDLIASEVEKSKDALLLAAQYKKAQREAEANADQGDDAETQELELLKAGIDIESAFGQTCKLCNLEIFSDSEIIVDTQTGAAYHFSAFLNDWPVGIERPKYVYRYPQDEVMRSTDLVRNF